MRAIPAAEAPDAHRLFQPITLRGTRLKNRIVVSPMSTYSAHDGFCDDFHLVHLGRFAQGGAGLVMMEASAVEARGRGTHGCAGIWSDAHMPGLGRIAASIAGAGAVPGIQLGHSGPKGATQRPWHGGAPLGADDAARGEPAWPLVSSSAQPFDGGWVVPEAMDEDAMDRMVAAYEAAARRARDAGFEVLELHCAHGYLLHAFLSPLLNQRTDRHGGSLENRMRFPLRVADAVRRQWPDARPLFVRVSSVDGVDAGWSMDDTVRFASELRLRGVDAVVCSSGGPKLPRGAALVGRTPGFQVPFAARVRAEAGMPSVAVGLIRTAAQAENILQAGAADLIALGRELLVNPNWPLQAALELEGAQGWRRWPDAIGWWLERRERSLQPRSSG
ncbi:MAG: NADH:flavin oxidoreductase/NADH oxidase [Variovorax sp.]